MPLKISSFSEGTAQKNPQLNFSALILISSFISCLFYQVFYYFSPIIWSMNIKIKLEECTPWVLPYFLYAERDGIEGYVLYFVMFAIIISTLLLWKIYLRLESKWARLLLLAVSILTTAFYLIGIGFHPPMVVVHPFTYGAIILLFLEKISRRLVPLIITISSIPVFFVAVQPVFWADLSYIFDPALKIVHGISYSNIYFQYDILLSLIAALWLKLGIDPVWFQALGQASLYLFVMGIYLFSRRLFINKHLSIALLVSLILVKVYANIADPSVLLQVTPLRLDLWFIIVLLIYYLGLSHWSVGLVLGLFVFLHRIFGIIYFFAYIQLLFMLLALDLATAIKARRNGGFSVAEVASRHFGASVKNIFFIVLCFVLSAFILGWGDKGFAVVQYQKVGIGFLRIARESFYWYVPVLFGALFVALISKKDILPKRYFTTGLFLVFVSIGNSLYFFGRSHENNIINISGALIMCLFLLLDLIEEDMNTRGAAVGWAARRRMAVKLLPYGFIMLLACCYQRNIIERIHRQYSNLKRHQLIYPLADKPDFHEIKKITRNSQKVYFMISEGDFPYYYYGGYVPVGFYSPYGSWLFKKDLSIFLQGLLDKGYYLVTDEESSVMRIMTELTYQKHTKAGKYLVVWK
jgi:hypothetical protein